jgi:hypothetical protein
MRVVRTVLIVFTAAGLPYELVLIGRWAAVVITAAATVAAVLITSTIAVMFGLS